MITQQKFSRAEINMLRKLVVDGHVVARSAVKRLARVNIGLAALCSYAGNGWYKLTTAGRKVLNLPASKGS